MSVMTTPETVLHPARSGPRPITAEDLWAFPRVGAPALSPDGKRFAVAVTTYDMEKNESRSRIWVAPTSGGEPVAFTSADVSSSEPAFSPDGRFLAFIRKAAASAAAAGKPAPAGAGKPQLWVLPLDGGEPRCLTNLPLGCFDPKWLPDGSGLIVAGHLIKGHLSVEATQKEIERRDADPVKAHITEDRVYRFWDTWLTTGEVPHLFRVDAQSGAARDLTPDSTVWFEFMDPSGQYDLSPDGKEIVLSGIALEEPQGWLLGSLYVVPVAGGSTKKLTGDGKVSDQLPRYSPDGKRIVYGRQHDPLFYADRQRVMEFDRATGQHRDIAPEWTLSPAHWTFGADGTLYLEAEDNARTAIFAQSSPGTTPKRIVHDGTISGVRAGRDRVWFSKQSMVSPPEIFTAALDGSSVTRVTRFTEPVANGCAWSEVREMTFEGSYG